MAASGPPNIPRTKFKNRPALNYLVRRMLHDLADRWECSFAEAAKRILNRVVPPVQKGLDDKAPFVEIHFTLPLHKDYWEYRTHRDVLD